MWMTDIFKTKEFKSKIETLEKKIRDMEETLTPEMQQIIDYNLEIYKLKAMKDFIENQIDKKKIEISSLSEIIEFKKENIIKLDEECTPREVLKNTDNYF